MQTQVLFEHPLNEKMRTWLRIEFLIQQLTDLDWRARRGPEPY